MIKSFRRSKRTSSNSSSPKQIRISGGIDDLTSANPLLSPKKAIKALYDYTPQGPGELKFNAGDFFHVIEESDGDWWKATNPITNQTGMVPITYFEVFNKTHPKTDSPASNSSSASHSQNNRNSQQTLYAVVLYEFKAEKSDELDIFPGENLIICAHHDYEWYIAKPINRLGGPGLVPVSYVKIVDLMNQHPLISSLSADDDNVAKIIDHFKIPTVEQWKYQTAKYQASTIPLGSITSNTQQNNGSQPLSANSQYFDKSSSSNRSSLLYANVHVLDAGVESYQLDHGRYIYLISAKLSNGKSRHLYRYYQDFYDLQVKLLELFPYEAGKIENSRRIIPSIPGPLINVNDSISRLRRSKLDSYLRELVALPYHISRSEEVLRLFEVLDNGFDTEFVNSTGSQNTNGTTPPEEKRTSRPVSQKSTSHHDRISQYSNFQMKAVSRSSLTGESPKSRSSSTGYPPVQNGSTEAQSTQTHQQGLRKFKVKFYFEEDIFVLLLPKDLRLQDLKLKLFKRLNLPEEKISMSNQHIQIFLKNDYDDFLEENNVETGQQLSETLKYRMKEFEVDDDEKFQRVIFDKCKLVILTDLPVN